MGGMDLSFFQPNREKTLRWGVIIIVVCLVISGGYMLLNQSQKRDATAAEIQAAQAYVPAWDTGVLTQTAYILGQCDLAQDQPGGDYRLYTSQTLGQVLFDCHRDLVIQEGEDGSVFLRYFTAGDDMVVLSFREDDLTELSIYDAATDELYYQTGDDAVIWTKFRTGFQFGK